MLPPAVAALAEAHHVHLVPPAEPGPGVCAACRNLISASYTRCYACARQPQLLDVLAIVSYSVAGGHWHDLLRRYKQLDAARRFAARRGLASVLWEHVARHEAALACAADVPSFDLVTVVPPSDPSRDERGVLRWVVGAACWPTRGRHRRLLVPDSGVRARRHRFDASCFRATEPLGGRSVLLVEDTWVTGARTQSAAAALGAAGARTVAAVVLGRHLNPAHADIAARLSSIGPFDPSVPAITGLAPAEYRPAVAA